MGGSQRDCPCRIRWRCGIRLNNQTSLERTATLLGRPTKSLQVGARQRDALKAAPLQSPGGCATACPVRLWNSAEL